MPLPLGEGSSLAPGRLLGKPLESYVCERLRTHLAQLPVQTIAASTLNRRTLQGRAGLHTYVLHVFAGDAVGAHFPVLSSYVRALSAQSDPAFLVQQARWVVLSCKTDRSAVARLTATNRSCSRWRRAASPRRRLRPQAACRDAGQSRERACARVCRSIRSISSRSVSAPGRSFLFPRTCGAKTPQ